MKKLFLIPVKLDFVPSFIVSEHSGFLKFLRKKSVPKMECPYCNGTMIIKDDF